MMQKSFLKHWRDNLPEGLKNTFAPVLRSYLTRNALFQRSYHDLISREKMTEEAVKEIQMSKLKNMLVHAYENVPYYHDLFQQVSFNPYHHIHADELKKIPVLTRELIRENFDRLISTKKVKGGYYVSGTGGSSGEPLKFLLDYYSAYQENAFIYYNRRALGYHFNDRVATFREIDFNGKNWKLSPTQNEILFSALRLSKLTVERYANQIRAFNPQYLNGYISSIWYFTKLLQEYNIRLDVNLKGVFFMSENIDASQRKFIEEYYGVKSFAHYGLSERCILAREVAPAQYVFDPFYGYTELLPEGNGQYAIIGTGLLSYTMPFIRYKTDDTCSPSEKGFFIDGKRNSTIGLYGHNNEFLTGSSFDLEGPVYKNILRYQFIQKEKGKADLSIVVNRHFDDSDLDRVTKSIALKTKGVMDFNIRIVDDLILTTRGKFQMYISDLLKQK